MPKKENIQKERKKKKKEEVEKFKCKRKYVSSLDLLKISLRMLSCFEMNISAVRYLNKKHRLTAVILSSRAFCLLQHK